MTEKSLSNSPLNLIVGKIHQSYTVACDELFMRGYMTQDERMAIGGLIGDLLQNFRTSLVNDIPSLASTVVNPDDVNWVVAEIGSISKIIDEIISPFTQKAGARHSSSDSKALQYIHDKSVALGASCPMMIFKEDSGKYRWVLFSSTAYRDRDGDIVSTKAQEDDCDEMNRTNNFGVLRWWHVGKPYTTVKSDWRSYIAGSGIDLGECDTSVMIKRVRVESGTFYHNEVGERLKEVANELSVSIGFSHPEDEPDREGVFSNVHTFERSLLPKGKQSNYFASIPVIEKESKLMNDNEKAAKLKEHLGAIFGLVMNKAEATDKAAEATGTTFKEGDEKKPDEKKPSGKFGDMDETEAKAFVGKCMDEYMASYDEKRKDKSEKETKQVTDTLEALQVSLKSLQSNDEKIATALNTIATAQKANNDAIKALQGDLPKSLKSLARSEAIDNIIPEVVAKQFAPANQNSDGLGSFLDWAATGNANGNKPPTTG